MEESKEQPKYTLEELSKTPYILYEGKRVYKVLEPIIFWEFSICKNCNKLNGSHSYKECYKCNLDPPYELDNDSSSTYRPSSEDEEEESCEIILS